MLKTVLIKIKINYYTSMDLDKIKTLLSQLNSNITQQANEPQIETRREQMQINMNSLLQLMHL